MKESNGNGWPLLSWRPMVAFTGFGMMVGTATGWWWPGVALWAVGVFSGKWPSPKASTYVTNVTNIR